MKDEISGLREANTSVTQVCAEHLILFFLTLLQKVNQCEQMIAELRAMLKEQVRARPITIITK